MPKRVHISLIHGTFAKNAGWTEETSSFCKSIVAGLDIEATFSRPQWSGRNRAKDRIAAADELAASLNAARSADPDCLQIAIGHSHGGSVLAYALARHPELAEFVASIFLSTPFIDARPRRNWFLTAMIVSFGFASVLIAAIAALESFLGFRYLPFVLDHIWLVTTFDPTFMVSAIIFYFAVFWVGKAIISSNPKRMARTISTCRLPTGRYLFVRTTGDEASGVLSTAQFSSWAFSRLVQGATSIFPKRLRRYPIKGEVPPIMRRYPVLLRMIALFRVKALVLLFMFMTLIASAYFANDFVMTNWLADLEHKQHPTETALSIREGLFALPASALSYDWPFDWKLRIFAFGEIFLALIAFAAFCYLFLITVFFLISWISQRAFGGASLAAVMSLEMAVEPTPIGSHTVVHATWATSYRGLTHSLAYQNPNTIAVVRTWIASSANP